MSNIGCRHRGRPGLPMGTKATGRRDRRAFLGQAPIRFDWGLANGTLLNYHSANTARILPKSGTQRGAKLGGIRCGNR